MKSLTPTISTALLGLFAASANAALVTGWSEVGSNQPLSDAGTASPTLGDGTLDSADTGSIFASIPSVTLPSIGSTIVLSGSVTFTTLSPTGGIREQFRFGLFNVNGSANDTNWLGYWTGNGDEALSGRLYEIPGTGDATFASGTGASTLFTADAPGVGFESGNSSDTYNFSLTITRELTGYQFNSSLLRTLDSKEFAAVDHLNATISTESFNRVGFLVAGNLNVETVQFNNIDVTAVPETSAAVLGCLGALALLRRRRA